MESSTIQDLPTEWSKQWNGLSKPEVKSECAIWRFTTAGFDDTPEYLQSAGQHSIGTSVRRENESSSSQWPSSLWFFAFQTNENIANSSSCLLYTLKIEHLIYPVIEIKQNTDC